MGADADEADEVLRNPPGHIAQLIQNDASQLAAMVGTIQHQMLSRSRLGVPALFHAEALSGFLAGGHMVFPSGTGLAAGWSPELVEQMADLIRRQMRRTGMMHALHRSWTWHSTRGGGGCTRPSARTRTSVRRWASPTSAVCRGRT